MEVRLRVWELESLVTMMSVVLLSGISYKKSKNWPLYQSGKRLIGSELSLPKRIEAMDRIVLIPFSVIQGGLGILACWNRAFSEDFSSRWYQSSPAARWCVSLYVSKTAFDIITQLITMFHNDAKRMEILLHHLLSALCIGYGVYISGQCHFFGCLATISELTTFFLNNVMAIKLFTGERTKRQKIIVAANGILLWFSYIFFRIVLFSFWLWRFFSDILNHKHNILANVSYFQLLIYPTTVAVIFFLSIYWFFLITRGLLKNLSVKRYKTSTSNSNNNQSSNGSLSRAANSNSTLESAVANKVK
mmetsp:Transcript_7759/g.10812  ORF Transcript_7759/g.10812 Transcript_7759/m.10812 type:complete len:304 (-) Transcript_7759:3693-4604(-)